MTVKIPENQDDRLMVEEINRKRTKGEDYTRKEMSFALHHVEYFIDSEELEKIDREVEEFGKELEKSCVRVKNPRAWTR